MNVVYASEHYLILAYPSHQAYELVERERSRSLFLAGAGASGFRAAIDRIPAEQRSFAAIDALLEEFCADSARPIVFH